MELCLVGKRAADTAPNPKRAPKQRKLVETVNSDSDSEFGIPKKPTAPKGETCLLNPVMYVMWKIPGGSRKFLGKWN